jgi:hypothetical protein
MKSLEAELFIAAKNELLRLKYLARVTRELEEKIVQGFRNLA